MNWVFLITFLEIALTLSCLYFLIKDGSKPERIWTWIFVIVFIPFIGAILYLAFGVNLRRQKIFDLKKEIDYAQFERCKKVLRRS